MNILSSPYRKHSLTKPNNHAPIPSKTTWHTYLSPTAILKSSHFSQTTLVQKITTNYRSICVTKHRYLRFFRGIYLPPNQRPLAPVRNPHKFAKTLWWMSKNPLVRPTGIVGK